MRSNIRFLTSAIKDRRLLFSPLSVACEQYSGKTPRRISTKLGGGGVRYGPRIMPLDFGLGPKSNMAAMAAILKKYLNFCFCIRFYELRHIKSIIDIIVSPRMSGDTMV